MRIFLVIFGLVSFLTSAEGKSVKELYSKQDIRNLSKTFLNSTNIENPVFADVDKDGDFDILKFNDKGFVEFHKNTGTDTAPSFILADRKYDNYEVHSLMGAGLPFPIFLADADGDGDEDLFALTGENKAAGSNVELVENQFEVTQGMLITIVLVLGIIALLIYIL